MIEAKQVPLPVRKAISRAMKAGKPPNKILVDALNAWAAWEGAYINVNRDRSESIILPLPPEKDG